MANPYAAIIGGTAGGALGGVTGYFGAQQQRKALQDYIAGLEGLQGEIGSRSAMRQEEISQAYNPMTEGYGQNFQDYLGALNQADYGQYDVAAPGEFDFDYQAETQRQMNPMIEAMLSRSADTLSGSAAGAGKLYSGPTGERIAREAQDITANQYGEAANRAFQMGQSKYQQYLDRFANALQSAQFNKGNLSSTLQARGTGVGAQGQMFGEQQGQLANIRGAEDQGYFDSAGRILGAQSQRNSINPWMSGLEGLVSGAAGGASMASGMGGFGNTQDQTR